MANVNFDKLEVVITQPWIEMEIWYADRFEQC